MSDVSDLKNSVAALDKRITTILGEADSPLQYVTPKQFKELWEAEKKADDKSSAEEWFASPAGIKAIESAAAKAETNGLAAAANASNFGLNAFGASWDIVKLELRPLFDISQRPNEWLGRVVPWLNNDPEPDPRITQLETRLTSAETKTETALSGVQRLDRLMTESRETLNGRIRNSNRRIEGLERRMGSVRTATRQTAGAVTHNSNIGSTATEAQRLQTLERHIQELSRALG